MNGEMPPINQELNSFIESGQHKMSLFYAVVEGFSRFRDLMHINLQVFILYIYIYNYILLLLLLYYYYCFY